VLRIQIRHRGVKLTRIQRAQLRARLDLALVRFGDRIEHVIVQLSTVEARYTRCELEVRSDVEVVRAEHSDVTMMLALEHAASRAARSVSRAIEKQGWALDR